MDEIDWNTSRWHNGDWHPMSDFPKVEAFLDEYEAVCRKHGFSLSHEDGHGAFIIEPYNDDSIKWVRGASFDG